MATNAVTGTSFSTRSLLPPFNHSPGLNSISGPRSALISSFGRNKVCFSLQLRSIRLKVSCAALWVNMDKIKMTQKTSGTSYFSEVAQQCIMDQSGYSLSINIGVRLRTSDPQYLHEMGITHWAKPETVDKVCKIVKKQLALPDDSAVTGESKFAALGADSLDTVEIVMGLEEEFGISVEEESAQSITTVQDAADLIEDIIQKKSS